MPGRGRGGVRGEDLVAAGGTEVLLQDPVGLRVGCGELEDEAFLDAGLSEQWDAVGGPGGDRVDRAVLGGADRAGDPAIEAYRVNAAAAKYSRVVAAELYGQHRAFGYLIGGSGGSLQVLGAAENTSGVWDGFVIGMANSIPSVFTARQHPFRVLKQRDRFPSIMDAIDPGGSGDPYAELNEEERAALAEATLLGFPPRGWWNHEMLNSGYFTCNAPAVRALAPYYAEDFWTKPGYLGTDPNSTIGADRFEFETTVVDVVEKIPEATRPGGRAGAVGAGPPGCPHDRVDRCGRGQEHHPHRRRREEGPVRDLRGSRPAQQRAAR